jgi:hypothetical protein
MEESGRLSGEIGVVAALLRDIVQPQPKEN